MKKFIPSTILILYSFVNAQEWVARYNGPGNEFDIPYAIAVDGVGNVYVTGESWGSGTYFDYATIKYSAVGVEEQISKAEHRTPHLEVYPNPSIRYAVIGYRVAAEGKISLIVYDLSGRLVRTYLGTQEKGKIRVDLPAGIYFIRVTINQKVMVIKKFTILR